MESFIPYAQHHLEEEDVEAIVNVLRSATLTRGPKVEEFEEELKRVVDAPYAVVFNSGTAALQAAYFAADGGRLTRSSQLPIPLSQQSGQVPRGG